MERIQQWVEGQPGLNCDIEIKITVRDGRLSQRIYVFEHDSFDGCFIDSLDELNELDFVQKQQEEDLKINYCPACGKNLKEE